MEYDDIPLQASRRPAERLVNVYLLTAEELAQLAEDLREDSWETYDWILLRLWFGSCPYMHTRTWWMNLRDLYLAFSAFARRHGDIPRAQPLLRYFIGAFPEYFD